MKTFEERKKEVEDWCSMECSDETTLWLKNKKIKCISIKAYSKYRNHINQPIHEVNVKLSYKENIFNSSLLLVISILIINVGLNEKYRVLIILLGILTLIGSIYYFIKIFDNKSKIILNSDGIWTDANSEIISWQNIIATYIRVEDLGESGAIHHLMIHHYQFLGDRFEVVEFKLKNLNMKEDEICFHIEKFKERAILLHN